MSKPTTHVRKNEMMLRTLTLSDLRAVNEEERSAEFVASTENAVWTWRGPEVLRMAGGDLSQFQRNPVVLDAHNRWDSSSIVGGAGKGVGGWVKREGRQLICKIVFAETARAEDIWKLVRGGFLRAVSIGYMIDPSSIKQLLEGETDGTGEAKVTGPAIVVKRWKLMEISMVPLPADEDALRRSFYAPTTGAEETRMAAEHAAGFSYSEVPGIGTTPNQANVNAAAAEPKAGAPAPAMRLLEGGQAPAPTPEELRARNAKAALEERAAIDAQIRAFTPADLKGVADDCILAGLGVAETRAKLLEARAKRSAPVGTPDPPAPQAPTTEKKKNEGDEIRALITKALG